MTKRMLTLAIAGVTLVALALLVLWVLDPIMTAIFMMSRSGAADAELIRQVWHYCLVPPEWIRPPNQWAKWELLEIHARLSVVVLGWTLSVAALTKRYLRGRQDHLTHQWSEPAPAVHPRLS
jgi:hypothetical protein